jgi:hypothetical protein
MPSCWGCVHLCAELGYGYYCSFDKERKHIKDPELREKRCSDYEEEYTE